jgi:hypothetical protein
MADTPERQIQEMAEALAEVLQALAIVLAHLPIPIRIGATPADVIKFQHIEGDLTRVLELIEAEPISEAAQVHLGQAIIGVLTAFDLLYLAQAEHVGWRLEGLLQVCISVMLNIHLAQAIISRS